MSRRDVRRRVDDELGALLSRFADGDATHQADEASAGEDTWHVCRNDPAVRQACEAAGLNCDNPAHLSEVLIALATARFGRRSPGRPKVWDSFSWSQLLLSFLRARSKHPDLTDEEVCNLLRENRMYDGYKAERLVRILQDAMDPEKNLLLRHALALMPEKLLRIVDQHRRHGSMPNWRDLPDHWDELKK